VTYYKDDDLDGWGNATLVRCSCAPMAPFTAIIAGDCNDSDWLAFPGAAERCNDADDDCDGYIDEDFPEKGTPCDGPDSDWCANGTWTCDPGGYVTWCVNETVVNVAEVCNGVDDDCDGQTDEEEAEGCLRWFRDSDHDGFGVVGSSLCRCEPEWLYSTQLDGDCADYNAAVHPGAPEACNNIDDDCDDDVDEDQGQTTCGEGACAHTADNCVNGVLVPCDPFMGSQSGVITSITTATG
jgi:hypothetical protein